MKEIITNSLKSSMSYANFRHLVSDLINKNLSTGKEQSEVLLNYSKLSDARMNRLDKKLSLNNETLKALSDVNKKFTFLVLMESWCGDGAQTLPVLNKMAEQSGNIDLKIALRDDNDALMQQFLTNGSKSIPKVIIIDKDTSKVYDSWGSRPSVAIKMVNDFKKINGSLDADFKKNLQIWYNKDKGETTQKDIVAILKKYN
jgi:thiol-disulfide isomerase/thioredoxin